MIYLMITGFLYLSVGMQATLHVMVSLAFAVSLPGEW